MSTDIATIVTTARRLFRNVGEIFSGSTFIHWPPLT
jgi:hypothetical protein